MVDPYDLAAVAAAARPAARGARLRRERPEALRPADRVRVLGAALGRDLRLEALSDEEARAQMTAEMRSSTSTPRLYVDGSLDESQVQPTVREVLGREPRTFEQWAAAHADAFR